MARNDPQFMLRMPNEMKNHLMHKAKENGRTMTAEILHRLNQTMITELTHNDLITSKQAMEIADKAVVDSYEVLIKRCMQVITKEAQVGSREAYIQTGYGNLCRDKEAAIRVLDSVVAKLQELGFAVMLIDLSQIKVEFS